MKHLFFLTLLSCVTAVHAQLPVDQVKTEKISLNDPLKGSFRANETTVDDQTDIAVTIYNRDLALVRDRRKITLFPGEISLTFMDVAQRIKPETVSLQSISQPGALRILEQNYEYDLMSPQKMMEKYVGKDVRLINFSNQLGFTEVDAKLLSTNQGAIYEINGQIYLGHPGNVVLPEIPENLIAKPSLIWLSGGGGNIPDQWYVLEVRLYSYVRRNGREDGRRCLGNSSESIRYRI